MLNSFTRAGKLKRWLARPDCPPFLKACKAAFDKAFGQEREQDTWQNDDVALRARHRFDNVFFSHASTHVGNSLILYYPDGDYGATPLPGSIEYIVVTKNKGVVYAVRRQLPAPSGSLDPFRFYPHFLAKTYSTTLSTDLQIIYPEWVISHYARWKLDKDRAVVLTLSRVSPPFYLYFEKLAHLVCRIKY
ncbi:hypothetical protein BDZ97DRAFT_1678653 [Flammula alnicola]|nr:hypothetical protein BDZ97DRAFT_1678653 [Flammula alnicola]